MVGSVDGSFARASVAERQCKAEILLVRMMLFLSLLLLLITMTVMMMLMIMAMTPEGLCKAMKLH